MGFLYEFLFSVLYMNRKKYFLFFLFQILGKIFKKCIRVQMCITIQKNHWKIWDVYLFTEINTEMWLKSSKLQKFWNYSRFILDCCTHLYWYTLSKNSVPNDENGILLRFYRIFVFGLKWVKDRNFKIK